MTRIRLAAAVAVALLAALLPLAGADDKEKSQRFQYTFTSDVTVRVKDTKQEGTSGGKVVYTLRRRGREAILVFDTMTAKATLDGKTVMDTTMSREKFSSVEDGKLVEIKAADAPAGVRRMLQDSFGVPLCRVAFDDDGKETKRTILAGPGARSVLDNGLIANALYFHAPFHAGRDKWQAEREVNMGSVGFGKATLTYERVRATKVGPVKVKVSGKLNIDSFRASGLLLGVKAGHYVFRGEQTYDPARKEWVSGTMTIEAACRLERDGKEVGTAKGTIRVSLKALPAEK